MSSCPSNRPVFGVCPIAMNTPSTAELPERAGTGVPDPKTGHPGVVAEDFVDDVVPTDRHVGVPGLGFEPVGEDPFRPEPVPAMDDVHRRSDVREVERLLDGGVAAADHRHWTVLEEEPVTRGAGRHAGPLVPFLRGDPEIPRGRSGGDDERIAGVDVLVADEAEGRFGEVRGVDLVKDRFGAETLRVRVHSGHQIRSLQPLHVPPASCPRPWWSSSVRPSRDR